MRRFLFILGIVTVLFSMQLIRTSSSGESDSAMAINKTAEIYFVDSEMLRLIPTTVYVDEKSVEKNAKAVIAELVNGHDDNPKILRTIPDVRNGVTVKVKNDTAYVNFSKKFVSAHTDNQIHEVLTVYSIVNSLSSLEGITKVRFTIDGKSQAEFKGSIDMRETFVPDYTI